MINTGMINGSMINGSAGFALSASLYDSAYVSESLSFSYSYQKQVNELANISEEVSFSFNKGLAQSEGLLISEEVLVALGNLHLYVNDEPVSVGENVNFEYKKEVLMETQIKYYLNLLIMQYRNKTKAKGHMTALIKAALIDLLPLVLQSSFNLDTASGKQLDTLGKYIGIKRRVKTFGSDVTLNDDDYRYLLKIKRATNSIGSSLYDIQSFVYLNLQDVFKVFDHKNMQMSFYLNNSIISNTLGQAIIKENLLPRPMGVSYSAVVFVPTFQKIFGFEQYAFNSGASVGFNKYTSYDASKRFISYEDTI